MTCRCYREIYSAVSQIPAAVITIISNYAHTFSDSDFKAMVGKYPGNFIILMDTKSTYASPFYNYTVSPQPYESTICYYIIMCLNPPHKLLLCIYYTHYDECKRSHYDAVIHLNDHIWDNLNHNFDPSRGDYTAHMANFWMEFKPPPNFPIPELFPHWCSTFVDLIRDYVYRKSHNLTCPWD